MTSTVTNLTLAKQGNPKAIEALIHRQLHTRGIQTKVNLKSTGLYILLESEQVPSKVVTFSFIQKGLLNLNPSGIDKVYVYGRQMGSDAPDWGESFVLGEKGTQINTISRVTRQDSNDHLTNFQSFGIASVESNSSKSLGIKEKLQEIEQLRIEGAITAEEYSALRNETLGVKPQPANSGISNNSNSHTVVNVVTGQAVENTNKEEKTTKSQEGGCYKQWALHLVLSIFTGGGWLLVWLILAIAKI
ncbi:hypothetical protein [Leptolyngbya sp. KIOST-1]|uniref:hypothetical protein n=1 Tax=Leptolyngbya sp. KIOST-1 TaxID=1229172 RepID=UPI0012E0900A|nr:hypothetical protein [Leptolyngbya sp. KIOST-1]